MVSLELPHINVLSKCDLIKNKEQLDCYLNYEEYFPIYNEPDNKNSKEYFTNTIKNIIFDYNLVSFLPLDVSNHESIIEILYQCDYNLQYNENREPDDKYYKNAENILNKENID